MNTPTAVLWDDDGPMGQTTRIEVNCGGNLDYYVHIVGEDWAGNRAKSDGFRVCTSGARCEVTTTVVATLHAVGRGDRERALRLARVLVQELEVEHVRLPDPDAAERCLVRAEPPLVRSETEAGWHQDQQAIAWRGPGGTWVLDVRGTCLGAEENPTDLFDYLGMVPPAFGLWVWRGAARFDDEETPTETIIGDGLWMSWGEARRADIADVLAEGPDGPSHKAIEVAVRGTMGDGVIVPARRLDAAETWEGKGEPPSLEMDHAPEDEYDQWLRAERESIEVEGS